MSVLDDAIAYLQDNFGPTYDNWMKLATADPSTGGPTKALQTLQSATRYIDRQSWQGTATGTVGNPPVATTLAWPRTGVYVDGVQLDPNTVPPQITMATFELAVLILDDPTIVNVVDSGSNVQSLGAGPARLAFFRPTSRQDGNATLLPPIIDALIGRFLSINAPTTGLTGSISGTSNQSNFRNPCRWCGSISGCCCAEQRPDVRWPV